MLQIREHLSRRTGISIWASLAALTLLVNGGLGKENHNIWQDEVQIIEYGRTMVFEPQSDWSVSKNDVGANQKLITYFGSAIMEAIFRLTGSYLVVRLFCLSGAILASGLLLTWLFLRGVRPTAVVVATVLFLYDWYFSCSYRGSRLDGWAFAACFLSFVFIELAGRLNADTTLRKRYWFAAGGSFFTAFMIWPSSAILAPLVLSLSLEKVFEWPSSGRGERTLRAAGAAITGVLIAGAVLLAPIGPAILEAIADFFGHLRAVSPGGSKAGLSETFVRFLVTMRANPFLWIAAFIGLSAHRMRFHLAAFSCSLAIALMSGIPAGRVLYLLPYLVFASAAVVHDALEGRTTAKTWALLLVVAAGAFFCTGRSLILRPAYAFQVRSTLSDEGLRAAALKEIGRGPLTVYDDTWRFYFVGRTLGWKQFRLYFANLDSPSSRAILGQIQYAIVPKVGASSGIEAALERAGLKKKKLLLDREKEPPEPPLGLSLGTRPYGPFWLYTR